MEESFIPMHIREYCEEASTPLAEVTKNIFASTINHDRGHMVLGKTLGNLLKIMVSSHAQDKYFEIGTFLGYATASICEGLSPPGCLYSCDEVETTLRQAEENLKCYLDRKVLKLILGEGLAVLRTFPNGFFRGILIDARKESFVGELETILCKLDSRGFLWIDNGLCGSGVFNPRSEWHRLTIKFNRELAEDSRFDVVMLPIRDGFTVAIKR